MSSRIGSSLIMNSRSLNFTGLSAAAIFASAATRSIISRTRSLSFASNRASTLEASRRSSGMPVSEMAVGLA